MGLYPPASSEKMIPNDLEVPSPPFNVRNPKQISSELGAYALPFGFNALPVMNVDRYEFTAINEFSCAYINNVYYQVHDNPDYFNENYAALMDKIR